MTAGNKHVFRLNLTAIFILGTPRLFVWISDWQKIMLASVTFLLMIQIPKKKMLNMLMPLKLGLGIRDTKKRNW